MPDSYDNGLIEKVRQLERRAQEAERVATRLRDDVAKTTAHLEVARVEMRVFKEDIQELKEGFKSVKAALYTTAGAFLIAAASALLTRIH